MFNFFFSEDTCKLFGNPYGKTSHELENSILEKAQSRVPFTY